MAKPQAVHIVEDKDGAPIADRPEGNPESDVADEALNAMTKAVASLRDQAARMMNTPPPLDDELSLNAESLLDTGSPLTPEPLLDAGSPLTPEPLLDAGSSLTAQPSLNTGPPLTTEPSLNTGSSLDAGPLLNGASPALPDPPAEDPSA